MATEPKTGLSFWPPGAMQPDLLFNALIYWLAVWAQPVVIAIEDDPPGSPDEGDTYIVGAGTGDWSGQDDDLAYWTGEVWMFFTPLQDYEVRAVGTGDRLVYDETNGWEVDAGGGGSTRSAVTAATSSSGTLTINYAPGDYFTVSLSENISAWSFSNMPGSGHGATLGVLLTQDSTPRTVAWPASFDWGDGVAAPTMPTGSGDQLFVVITTFNNGTVWHASSREPA